MSHLYIGYPLRVGIQSRAEMFALFRYSVHLFVDRVQNARIVIMEHVAVQSSIMNMLLVYVALDSFSDHSQNN